MFGGNSNWRGPIWMPMNVLVIRALLQCYMFYGDSFVIECPTGSGREMNLFQVAKEIAHRLTPIFLRGKDGRRPVYGGAEIFQKDPHWRNHLLFYEYFHGDNGAGLGASHQTGWTGSWHRSSGYSERSMKNLCSSRAGKRYVKWALVRATNMKSLHLRDLSRPGIRLATCTLIAILAAATPVFAQTAARGAAPPPAAPAPKAEERKDALGRETPRGTLLGFMRAARGKNDEAASHYLNTDLAGAEAFELSRELYVVLDSRLPARLSEVSNSPEGSLANPLRPTRTWWVIRTQNGPLELIVERVSLGTDPPVWLFSQRTLEAIPEVFDEIDVVPVEYPGFALAGTPVRVGCCPANRAALVPADGVGQVPGSVSPVDPGARDPLGRAVSRFSAARAAVMDDGFGFSDADLRRVAAPAPERLRRPLCRAPLPECQPFRGHLARAARASDCRCVRGRPRRACGVSVLCMDPTAALAGLGIGGIAVLLAAQGRLENVIGGVLSIFDKAVRVGDVLKVGDAAGTVGVVDSIGLRSTRIRTTAPTILTVPNGQIANVSLETLSARDMCWFIPRWA